MQVAGLHHSDSMWSRALVVIMRDQQTNKNAYPDKKCYGAVPDGSI
jgi:hypothetical protein